MLDTDARYKIVRRATPIHAPFLAAGYDERRTIKTGLTLDEAQAICRDPQTCSSTATDARSKRLNKRFRHWSYGYQSQ